MPKDGIWKSPREDVSPLRRRKRDLKPRAAGGAFKPAVFCLPGKSDGLVEKSLVQSWMEDGNQKVGEMRGALIHLKPADHAMVRKVFGDASFRYSEMLSELRLDGLAVARRSPKQLADGDA
jgi:hypothetical protein